VHIAELEDAHAAEIEPGSLRTSDEPDLDRVARSASKHDAGCVQVGGVADLGSQGS
jgi:hypothetical protein